MAATSSYPTQSFSILAKTIVANLSNDNYVLFIALFVIITIITVLVYLRITGYLPCLPDWVPYGPRLGITSSAQRVRTTLPFLSSIMTTSNFDVACACMTVCIRPSVSVVSLFY
jgi:hypothetical protein